LRDRESCWFLIAGRPIVVFLETGGYETVLDTGRLGVTSIVKEVIEVMEVMEVMIEVMEVRIDRIS
jgi:hypothetical protein